MKGISSCHHVRCADGFQRGDDGEGHVLQLESGINRTHIRCNNKFAPSSASYPSDWDGVMGVWQSQGGSQAFRYRGQRCYSIK